MATKSTVKKPKLKLSGGVDGNIFNILGLASGVLKKAGQPENAKELTSKVFDCGSYDEALQLVMKYCDVD